MESLNELMEDNEIVTFANGAFTPEIRQVVMTLCTECNVSLKNVNGVIQTVLKTLVGKVPQRLPSQGALCRILTEAKYIANKQVADEILSTTDIMADKASCLHNDGTTKKHREYECYQTTLPTGKTLSLGMIEVPSQSADNNFEAFKNLFSELASTSCPEAKDRAYAELITTIQTTMSDQGATNPKFFSLINSLRNELLPLATENWDQLPSEVQAKLARMSNFFCKLHLLGNFESNTLKTALEFENSVCQGRNPNAFTSESCGTNRLCKNTSKVFHHDGCQTSGKADL